MTDPTPDSSESAAKPEDQFNFNWWVTMLPFLAAICWFIFQWSHDRGNMTWLVYSGIALVVGLVLGSVVAAASSGTADGGTGSEPPK